MNVKINNNYFYAEWNPHIYIQEVIIHQLNIRKINQKRVVFIDNYRTSVKKFGTQFGKGGLLQTRFTRPE